MAKIQTAAERQLQEAVQNLPAALLARLPQILKLVRRILKERSAWQTHVGDWIVDLVAILEGLTPEEIRQGLLLAVDLLPLLRR